MRRLAPLTILTAILTGCLLARPSPPPSPHCRSGSALAGVYHPQRLRVKNRCVVAVGTVERVKFEEYDGDVHLELRVDPTQRDLLGRGNDQVSGTLIVEIIPQDRSRVRIPEVGMQVSVVGPWVDDTTHDWNEVHPAWWISSGRIQPATEAELRRVRLLLQGAEPAGSADDA
ncbi:MAG: hypothetical protein M3R70_06385 [Actinomycetota bacterium]|nr:hypothetical protein [Actinomycetota bacterium]